MTTKPSLPDPVGIAHWVALEIMALAPECRAEAVANVGDVLAAVAEVEGCSPVDAAALALRMRRDIRDAMRAIEVSGGDVGGRG